MFPQPHQLVRSSIYIYLQISTYIYTPPGALRQFLTETFHPRIPSRGLGRGRTVSGAAQLLGSPVSPHLHLSSVSQLQLHCSEAHCVDADMDNKTFLIVSLCLYLKNVTKLRSVDDGVRYCGEYLLSTD